MGVSACGKSTLASALAKRFNCPMLEGDDFHPQDNVSAMRQGIALSDAQRLPWLRSINHALRSGAPSVLSCSALTANYRNILTEGLSRQAVFVYIHAKYETLLARMQQRAAQTKHFMPVSLLRSQFEILETPDETGIQCITVSASDDTEQQMKSVLEYVSKRSL
jgi:gluconokinase